MMTDKCESVVFLKCFLIFGVMGVRGVIQGAPLNKSPAQMLGPMWAFGGLVLAHGCLDSALKVSWQLSLLLEHLFKFCTH